MKRATDPQRYVLLYSTSIHTWEVWEFGRPIAHGTLESCQRAYPGLVPGYSQLLIECRYGRTHHDHDGCPRPRDPQIPDVTVTAGPTEGAPSV